MKDSTINHHSAGAPDTSTMPEGAAATTCGVQMRYMGMLLEQESLLTETELMCDLNARGGFDAALDKPRELYTERFEIGRAHV